jgi:predicted phage terminase large subunit-like protein
MNIPDLDTIERMIAALPPKKIKALMATPGIRERLGAKCQLTARQIQAEQLLRSPAKHVMLFGGSRSGKTFQIIREVVGRALLCTSRHAILRFRFNAVIQSVWHDTMPKAMALCFPGCEYRMDKKDFFWELSNNSQIWFGGLDEKERTEKILGMEFATLVLNECSQIQVASRDVALTRLAQKTELPLKAFYDCNPPSKRHWTYQIFINKIDPARHQPLRDPDNYAALLMNPGDNRENLPADYIAELENLDERRRRRFLLGVFSDEDGSALWTLEMLDKGRLLDGSPPDMQRVIIAVDPSGCRGPEDLRSDEIGIIVAGLGTDGRAYVLEDLSGRFGPETWKTVVASAYHRWQADAVVGETNYGGAMVQEVIRTASTDDGYPLTFREVTASRGKVVRAEPIAALFEQGKVSLVGRFLELENQLCSMTLAGYMGDRSPDRLDAMVWALSALFPAVVRESRKGAGRTPKVITSISRSRR